MRVICIDASLPAATHSFFVGYRKDWFVKEGETYNVANQYPDIEYGILYDLSEDPKGGKWASSRFALLSEIDETEFERNYQKELV